MIAIQALGFDIGGTSTKLGLVSLSGEIEHFRQLTVSLHLRTLLASVLCHVLCAHRGSRSTERTAA